MANESKSPRDYEKEYDWSHVESLKHWRSWGSWFSWGSPVGLGLFFISIAITVWILGQTFGWK
ncbi:hypothetical protein EPO04_00445 [Patescibacteria group bacterium]|nr:MAG: hypothetical protein EPO04_00445 [Patescibacteria group bacterium]